MPAIDAAMESGSAMFVSVGQELPRCVGMRGTLVVKRGNGQALSPESGT